MASQALSLASLRSSGKRARGAQQILGIVEATQLAQHDGAKHVRRGRIRKLGAHDFRAPHRFRPIEAEMREQRPIEARAGLIGEALDRLRQQRVGVVEASGLARLDSRTEILRQAAVHRWRRRRGLGRDSYRRRRIRRRALARPGLHFAKDIAQTLLNHWTFPCKLCCWYFLAAVEPRYDYGDCPCSAVC